MIYCEAGSVIIRDAKKTDKFELRKADKREIWASHHREADKALIEGYNKSIMCFTVEYKKRPIAMFGVVPHTILGSVAQVWLLASSEMNKMNYIFKHSRKMIDIMLSHYPLLENFVDIRNKQSIKWLKWCGASLGPVVPYGVEQKLFQYFQFQRSDK